VDGEGAFDWRGCGQAFLVGGFYYVIWYRSVVLATATGSTISRPGEDAGVIPGTVFFLHIQAGSAAAASAAWDGRPVIGGQLSSSRQLAPVMSEGSSCRYSSVVIIYHGRENSALESKAR
jgi:hypothetical protein